MKRKRPHQHTRIIRTKKGKREIIINKGILKKKRKRFLQKPQKKHLEQIRHQFERGELIGQGDSATAMKTLISEDFIPPKEIRGLKIIEEKGEVFGTAKTRQLEGDYNPGDYVISKVFIKKPARKKGVGTKLIKNIFKDPKIDTLYGYSYPPSEGFWKKQGAQFHPNIKDPKGHKFFRIKKKN